MYLDFCNVFDFALHNILIKNNYRCTKSVVYILNGSQTASTQLAGGSSVSAAGTRWGSFQFCWGLATGLAQKLQPRSAGVNEAKEVISVARRRGVVGGSHSALTFNITRPRLVVEAPLLQQVLPNGSEFTREGAEDIARTQLFATAQYRGVSGG